MRWSDCHRGNVAQAPVEGQPAINEDLKVPEPEVPAEEESAEEEAEPKLARASADTKDAPKASDAKPSDHATPHDKAPSSSTR